MYNIINRRQIIPFGFAIQTLLQWVEEKNIIGTLNFAVYSHSIQIQNYRSLVLAMKLIRIIKVNVRNTKSKYLVCELCRSAICTVIAVTL
jgi:hypothetical protein